MQIAPVETQQSQMGSYEQSFGPELRAAISGMNELGNVAEWAEFRLSQQGQVAAARACEDVHEAAHLTKQFVLRGSPFAASAAEEFQRVLQGAIQELQQSGATEAQEVLRHAQLTAQQLESSRAALAAVTETTP